MSTLVTLRRHASTARRQVPSRQVLLARTIALSRKNNRVSPIHVVVRSLSTSSNDCTSDSAQKRPASSVSTQTRPPSSSLVTAYMDLSKARLSSLVVATTAAGFVAGGGPFSTATLEAACLGTALCSSSASGLNQIFEMDRDARMKRTRHRPLVNGLISKQHAALAATTWGVAGASVLAVGTDPVTTALGIGNIFLYSGLYTYMKPRSKYNTWVGAVVGAIPPVMGWTASGGSIMDVEAVILGGTLYLWQMPHFFALSYMHRADYKRGGFQMVPVLEENGDETAQLVTRYTWYLSSVPIVATLADVTSSMFAMEGIALNGYALYVAKRFQDERTNANARKIFLTSLWYLPTFLMLFLLHSKTWDDKEKDKVEDYWRQHISSYVHAVRERGKLWCVHETAVLSNDNGDKACPVAVGKQKTHDGKEVATNVVTAAIKDTSKE